MHFSALRSVIDKAIKNGQNERELLLVLAMREVNDKLGYNTRTFKWCFY
jgi:hypothetical protein